MSNLANAYRFLAAGPFPSSTYDTVYPSETSTRSPSQCVSHRQDRLVRAGAHAAERDTKGWSKRHLPPRPRQLAKGGSRRDTLTAKLLLPPFALESSASTVGPKPSGGRCTGNRSPFARVRCSPAPRAGLWRGGLGEIKAGSRRSRRALLRAWSRAV